MRKTTDTFSFELPAGWKSFNDGTRLVAQGPGGEELIVSSWAIKPPPEARADEIAEVVDRLFDNARHIVEDAAAHPDLIITKSFERDLDAGGCFPCWTLLSQTAAGDLFFGEAVIRGGTAVMVVTLEAPNSPSRQRELAAFLETFGPSEP